ncbi:MAG: hypothetical protein ACR2N6_02090 [Miltoncostaeaceae bacterium]
MPSPRFPLRRSRWSWLFLIPRSHVEVSEEAVRVGMGWLGRAEIPMHRITGLGRMRWPVIAGIGVRLGGGMVAYVSASGPAVLIRLDEPLSVKAPFSWKANRVIIAADDPDALIDAIAERRGFDASEVETDS